MGKECYDIVLHWIQDRNKKPSVTCIRALIKPAGKIVISFNPLLPESLYDVYGELNPLNLGRLMVITISKAGQKLKRCVQLKALK